MNVQKQPPEAFCKKICFWKFHKQSVPESFLNKVAGLMPVILLKKRDSGLRPATLLKKETQVQVFSCEFSEISKGKDTLWNFSFKAFHEIQFQGHFMKYEILS